MSTQFDPVWVVVKNKTSMHYAEAHMEVLDEGVTPTLPSRYDAAVYELVVLESLGTLTPEPKPPSAIVVIERMRTLFQSQPLPLQYEFKQGLAEIEGAAMSNNIPLMRYIVEQLDLSGSQLLTVEQGEGFRAMFLATFN
jgi:hypothetical protein